MIELEKDETQAPSPGMLGPRDAGRLDPLPGHGEEIARLDEIHSPVLGSSNDGLAEWMLR